ncbi:MAG: tRNA epoxyqueuosine(34) reductase QueG [Pseudomonadota bacterium]
MSALPTAQASLTDGLKSDAKALGFDACGIAPAALPDQIAQRLHQFVELGRHGQMGWMADTLKRRASPNTLWSEARSAIMLALNYGPEFDPLQALDKRGHGTISVYAHNRDYHDVIKGKLKVLAGKFASRSGRDVKVFVDTAPVMEKPLAALAGLGWQGKHTNLVSRSLGSWTFLGAIFTTAELESDSSEADHCGRCTACLDVCPTKAFPAPYQLDARRCISYLTIEHKGVIKDDLKEQMGNRIYGCDDCLAVCPWNKFAQSASETKLQSRSDRQSPKLAELVRLDDAGFRQTFSGGPIKRIGINRFLRNVLIAIGNSGKANYIGLTEPHCASPDDGVRDAARWAKRQLQKTDE